VRRHSTVLQGYSREIVATEDKKTITSITCQALAALFQVPVVVMLVTEGEVVSLERAGGVDLQEAEPRTAQSSLATGTVVRAEIYPVLASRFYFWPVVTAVAQDAVLGLQFDLDERPSAPDGLVNIVPNILALVLDRQQFRVRRATPPTS
jgi:K+-sensing histidine kinase KdpD